MEIVLRVSGMCLAGVWQVSFGCLEGVLMVSGRCLKGVWRESMECCQTPLRLENPNSTSVGWSRS